MAFGNSGDTILISAAVPPFSPLGDMVPDAGSDVRHGFSRPRGPLRESVWCPRITIGCGCQVPRSPRWDRMFLIYGDSRIARVHVAWR